MILGFSNSETILGLSHNNFIIIGIFLLLIQTALIPFFPQESSEN